MLLGADADLNGRGCLSGCDAGSGALAGRGQSGDRTGEGQRSAGDDRGGEAVGESLGGLAELRTELWAAGEAIATPASEITNGTTMNP